MNSVRMIIVVSCCLYLPACAEFKEAGRTIGHTTRDVTRDIGHGTRDAAKAIGRGTKRVVKAATSDEAVPEETASDDKQ